MKFSGDTIESGNLDKYLKDTPFILFQSTPEEYQKMARRSYHQKNEYAIICQIFFHPKNVEFIQQSIIKCVYRLSKGMYKISPQNPKKIKIMMGQTLEKDIPPNISLNRKILHLDKIVVYNASKSIISELQFREAYRKRSEGREKLIHLPQCTTSKSSPPMNFLY